MFASDVELDPGEVRVHHAALDAPLDLDALRAHLAPDEQARAARFRFDRDRRRFVVARGRLRVLLARHLETSPADIAFSYGAHGKPALVGSTWLRFNVSHSHELALFALARDREVGVDVEHVRTDIRHDDLARRYFSAREQAALRGLPDPERLDGFFRTWTFKEAFLKATGQGVSRPLGGFDVLLGADGMRLTIADAPGDASCWTLHRLDVASGYAAALVVEGVPSRVSVAPLP